MFAPEKNRCASSAYVRAGRSRYPQQPPGNKTITKAQERFGSTTGTAHDLRRTAVSNMAERGIAAIALGHIINHRSVTKAGVTLSVYAHYDYVGEKAEALDLRSRRIDALGRGGAKIVPIRKA